MLPKQIADHLKAAVSAQKDSFAYRLYNRGAIWYNRYNLTKRRNTLYKLKLKYVYSFYNFGVELDTDVIEQEVAVGAAEVRFTLHQQEDSSFIVSPVNLSAGGSFVVLTHPNKDTVVVREGECQELIYDEYFDSMGDDNHNVYEGAVTLEGGN